MYIYLDFRELQWECQLQLGKGSGVEVARGSKRLRNYVVEETDTEEEVEISDGSEMVCFIRNVNII